VKDGIFVSDCLAVDSGVGADDFGVGEEDVSQD
jgi:hypothetical protein